MRYLLGLFVVATCAGPVFAAGRAMTVDDLLAVKSVSDPQVSPDGKLVVYVVSELDKSSGKSNSDLYLIPFTGGEPKRLTTSSGPDNHPRWSPDGRSIAFLSTRGGSSQIWLLPIDGGEARPITKLPIDVSGPVWSPKGDKIAFAASVFPGKSPEETAELDEQKGKEKSKVKTYDKLMVRHWDTWDDGKRSHLFVADVATGKAKDVTLKLEVNVPPAPFGGSTDYTFSPNGQDLAFTAEPVKDIAWSTNTDIWTVSTEGGEPRNLTQANPGADAQPSYSPDGKGLAYVSQARAGFEADLWVLKIRDLTNSTAITESFVNGLDRPIMSYVWSSRGIDAVIDDQGGESILSIRAGRTPDGVLSVSYPLTSDQKTFVRSISGGANTGVSVSSDGRQLAFVRSRADHPAEIYTADRDVAGRSGPLTHHNDALVKELDLTPAEPFSFKGADGDPVSGWLIKPPGFDPSKKYPVVFLIHGGPQGAWHDDWHNRWNYALFAAPGYAVVAINPRGSTGYGQKFTDQISQDWTGRVFEDLMKGLDHALKTYSFLDGSKMAAAGGSYGGFMVNWIAGHSDRFKALVSHAGVFDLTSMYNTTEELWFAEWEFGGLPWESPKIYLDQTPSAAAGHFKTPTLVIHGSLDFRVPEAQGLGMFTALQRQGVPSRLVLFPDEGHWIARPANRVVWWNEVHQWLAKYLAQ